MVYAELAPRRQQFHAAPAMQQPNSALNTPLPWTFKNKLYKNDTVTHSESHAAYAQCACCRADNSAI